MLLAKEQTPEPRDAMNPTSLTDAGRKSQSNFWLEIILSGDTPLLVLMTHNNDKN